MKIIKRIRSYSPYIIGRMQSEKIVQDLESNPQKDWEDKILSLIENNIIYLPTYRRIEENFNKYMNNDYRYRNDIIKKFQIYSLGWMMSNN